MEIILKQDVKNLGYADEIVKVKNGYGLNYLIPKGMAVIASEANKKVHTETMKQRAHKLAKIKGDAEKLADAISSVTLTIPVKVGENGKLYGSVTSQNIADSLKKLGYSIDKKQIEMPEEHIRKTGTYSAAVALHRDIKAKINFDVVENA
ncbi:MAG: 50S ribosomal protein L9 [Bacteroidota bacterium]